MLLAHLWRNTKAPPSAAVVVHLDRACSLRLLQIFEHHDVLDCGLLLKRYTALHRLSSEELPMGQLQGRKKARDGQQNKKQKVESCPAFPITSTNRLSLGALLCVLLSMLTTTQIIPMPE